MSRSSSRLLISAVYCPKGISSLSSVKRREIHVSSVNQRMKVYARDCEGGIGGNSKLTTTNPLLLHPNSKKEQKQNHQPPSNILFQQTQLVQFAVSVFKKLGLNSDESNLISSTLVQAEISGEGLGVKGIPKYAKQLLSHDASPDLRVGTTTEAIVKYAKKQRGHQQHLLQREDSEDKSTSNTDIRAAALCSVGEEIEVSVSLQRSAVEELLEVASEFDVEFPRGVVSTSYNDADGIFCINPNCRDPRHTKIEAA